MMRWREGWACCVFGWLLLASGGGFQAASAGEATPERLVAELAAGEFAPALEGLRQTGDLAARDAGLVRVFQAQQQSGAANAALQTWSQIAGDNTRQSALNGAAGGSSQADFDSLVQLIQGTIAPTTWSDVGGQGAVRPFPGGVLADTAGTLQRITSQGFETELAAARLDALRSGGNIDVRRLSEMRKVSLPRLEKAIQMRLAKGLPLDSELLTLAGLRRVKYVFVYPETRDVVLAGPAGDWRLDHERRLVAVDSGRPLARIEDLITLLRAPGDAVQFGCSITPTQAGLAKTQAFLDASSKRALRPGERETWLAKLREQLGRQEIEVFGIDPRSRAALVLVEADYRMKLVGLGLEEGTLGVKSYLASVEPKGAGNAPLDILRWWFTMNYSAVVSDADRHIFEIRGQGVKVLSENELLAANGQRVHTGSSTDRNQEFAASFTQHFEALSAKYPVYAELQNVFDLALVAALLKREHVAETAGWQMLALSDPKLIAIKQGDAPREVDTVMNHRVVGQTQIIAAISGGVSAEPGLVTRREAIKVERSPKMDRDYNYGKPRVDAESRWWWD